MPPGPIAEEGTLNDKNWNIAENRCSGSSVSLPAHPGSAVGPVDYLAILQAGPASDGSDAV